MPLAIADRVRLAWTKAGDDVPAGASESDIADVETRRGHRLPEQVRSFYRAINGNELAGPDLFEFWPVEKLASLEEVATFQGIPDFGGIVRTLPNAADYLAFGDVMIWSHVLAVRVAPAHANPSVVWLCGPHWAQVADTFDDFWHQYLADPNAVLWATSAHIHEDPV
jgi:hypothetical protein